jgi:transcriptional antiterminator NusG
MKSQWFVLHTLSGQELKVKESIEKRLKAEEMTEEISEVLVPMEKVAEVRGGKKSVSTRKLHPVVYINMVLYDESQRVIPWRFYFIKETPGVIGFIGRPAADGHAGRDGLASRPKSPSRRSPSAPRSVSMWGRTSRSTMVHSSISPG